jgi:Tfp pilus assembly protein PilO
MATLSRRERSLIGLGLAAALAVTAYLTMLEPLLVGQREAAALIPTRETTLERRRLLIAQRERLVAEGDVTARRLEAVSARLLLGPTAPLAASELQKLMKEQAITAAVEVRSERVLPPTDLGGLLEIPIELTVAGTIRETVALLDQIDRSSRLLTVKDLKIRLVAPGQPRELLSTLTLAGYLRSGAALPKPPARAAPAAQT